MLMMLYEQAVFSVQFDLCIAFSLAGLLVETHNMVLLLARLLLKVVNL